MTPEDRQERWTVAIHESGHIVAGYVLGATLYSAEIVNHCGAASYNGLCRFDDAMAIAAGPAAEEAFADVPPPATDPAPVDLPQLAQRRAAGAPPHSTILATNPLGIWVSDARRLAEWATYGIEDEPERWAGRVYASRVYGDRIVRDHAELVLKVARELFHRGLLLAADLAGLLPPKPKPNPEEEDALCQELT